MSAIRYCGSLTIRIKWDGNGADPSYLGSIVTPDGRWGFDGIRLPSTSRLAVDCSEAYDEVARAAVAFGAYYSHGNRGSETPDWAPREELADAIDDAMERGELGEPRILRRKRREEE